MKLTYLLLPIMIFLIGCNKTSTKSDEISDDSLINAIIESDQTDISAEEIHPNIQETINQNYDDYLEINASMAPNLGYQISMDGKGHKPGYRNEVFFDLNGRKLISKKGIRENTHFLCFELVLPVTFIMPDETNINIKEENDYNNIKTWYMNNSETKSKPTIKFPVDIMHDDGFTQTLNNHEEMKDISYNCKRKINKKNNWQCFKFIYPITYDTEDGLSITMDHSEDWSELKSWHESNPTLTKPVLRYPVDIIFKDESTKNINDELELRSSIESCNDN